MPVNLGNPGRESTLGPFSARPFLRSMFMTGARASQEAPDGSSPCSRLTTRREPPRRRARAYKLLVDNRRWLACDVSLG